MDKELKDGALIDIRTDEEKAKDIQFQEIVASANPVVWIEKISTSWRKFPIFNQDSSGSCVAQTLAKLIGVLYYIKNGIYIHFSATHIYQRRSNKPAGGMSGTEAFDIAQGGVTLEALVPSQDMNDSQMDGIKIEPYKEDVGKIFKIGKYIVGPVKDIETIASIIQTTGKAVMVWYYFNYPEWTDVPTVLGSVDLYLPATCRHSVTAVDFTLHQGKKCLIIEDSWGPNYGKGGQRIITEDFHKARNWFVAHTMNFSFDEVIVKPEYQFTKTLKFGDASPDIIALQDILKFEGLFPTNIGSTGYYGAITATAVLAFQKKHKVAPDSELDPLAGKSVGPKTITKLNELY